MCTPSPNAAEAPITDQIIGIVANCQQRGVASNNIPAVKIVAGHGTPKVGILVRLRCSADPNEQGRLQQEKAPQTSTRPN